MAQSIRKRTNSSQREFKPTDAPSSQSGFTLIELLIVMAILVLLASVVAPRVINYLGSSRSKAAQVQIDQLGTSLELFKLDTGRYPSASEGLRALVEKPLNLTGWSGPYLKRKQLPKDPWGNPYHYRFPGQFGDFDIYSLGSDNQEGGEGETSDVTSWQG